jgi:SAM-dependent methyltransferase
MTGADSATLDYYSAKAADYADRMAGEAENPVLARFAALLPRMADVMDFGCGPGWAADRFRAMGFRVSAFDGSAGLVEEARRRYGLEVAHHQFADFEAEAAYDGIWASFCLLHDSREAMPGHLGRMHRALRPGGVLYLGLKEGTGAHRDTLDRLYTYFTMPEMAGLLDRAGFGLLGYLKEDARGMDGTMATGLHIFARRD